MIWRLAILIILMVVLVAVLQVGIIMDGSLKPAVIGLAAFAFAMGSFGVWLQIREIHSRRRRKPW